MAGGHKKLAKGHKKLEKKGGTRNWPKRAQETGGSSPDSGEGHKKLGAQVLILAKRAQETDSEGLKCSSARGNGLEPSNLLTLRGLKCSSARGNGLEPFDFDQLLEGSSAAQQGETEFEVSKKKGGTRNWPKRAQETGGSSAQNLGQKGTRNWRRGGSSGQFWRGGTSGGGSGGGTRNWRAQVAGGLAGGHKKLANCWRGHK